MVCVTSHSSLVQYKKNVRLAERTAYILQKSLITLATKEVSDKERFVFLSK